MTGLPLPQEDVRRLEQNMLREKVLAEGGSVSLEQFCDVVGIPVVSMDDKTLVISNPREQESDGGTFRNSLRSQAANPTNSTTFFLGGDARHDRDSETGDHRRKVQHATYNHDNQQPHKFWEMRQSEDNIFAFPSPMPSLSHPLECVSHSLDTSSAVRGLVQLQSQSVSLSQHLASTERIERSRSRIRADQGGHRRASSAPPRVSRANTSSGMWAVLNSAAR
ncbi:hypothetical protein B484DRAFT_200845 [Ochromonadaceae sp. CCMP2298]|nr:hypothetical protein B484DRAFT_200845 [Ochromonadaceae sp. CCMP2298]